MNKKDIEDLKLQIANIDERMIQIIRSFAAIHPTIVDGKIKEYAIYNGRYATDTSQIPEEDKPLFSAGLKNSTNAETELMPGAIYYERDKIRPTDGRDWGKFPDLADKLREHDELIEKRKELYKIIQEEEVSMRMEQEKIAREKQNDLNLLRQTFPGIDLNNYQYSAGKTASEIFKIMKSEEQLIDERENLYQMTSQVQGTIHQRKAILETIDRIYGDYITKITPNQEEIKTK
jgi:hypothetical protein